jgi:high affinity Mn2+ porin
MRKNCLYAILLCFPVVAADLDGNGAPVPPVKIAPQTPPPQSAQPQPEEKASRWSIHFQATSIGQGHGGFPALYQGANSLPSHSEYRTSLTSTLFAAFRLNEHTEFVVNPEIAGGKGFGAVTGIAGFTNGEIPRVASATPALYVARGYVRNTFALSAETEFAEGDVNQTAGPRPVERYTSIVGKFGLSDFFDNNAYSHDPRTQFMNWAIMYNGAFDYPADVRGYTVGIMQELTMRNWSLRAAVTLEPTVANGPTLDWRVAKNRGDVFEYEQRYKIFGLGGTLRTLGFLNREDGGSFLAALAQPGVPDIITTRRNGTAKYGFGENLEQAITSDIGVFGRYGWADGKTEAWAFTQIDRTVSGGVSVQGRRWHRAKDQVGIGAVRNYLSGDQRAYLARGGMGFIIGDGRLNYAPESILEAYYAWRAAPMLTLTADYQHIVNPAYNQDRGPVSVYSIRVHIER